jgi:uncharacterized membrane protein YphA (DoxX/SURF4 family)
MKKVSFDYRFAVRALIGALFVVAGLSKIGVFGGWTNSPLEIFKAFYGSLSQVMTFLPEGLLPLIGLAVVLIEVPIALLYVIGYKKNWTGGALIAFTIVVTIFYHNPWYGPGFQFSQLVNALKNIAIIAGILATLDCFCRDCRVEGATKKHH